MTILGKPRTKKTSNRVVRAGQYTKVLPSQAFIDWQKEAVPQIKAQWGGQEAICRPVNVRAVFYRDALRGDAVGYYQALADALQTAEVVEDDKWIVSWDQSRLRKDAANPRVEIEITDAEEG